MATYVSTIKFTQKGIEEIRESSRRATAFKAMAKKMGVKVSAIYWTLGAFDGLVIFDAADDASATAVMLELSSRGNVQTSTSRAFDAAEMEKVVAKLSK